MRAVLAIAFLAVVALVVLAFIVWLIGKGAEAAKRSRAAKRAKETPWEVDDLDLPDGSTQVALVKPGQPNKLIGPAIPASLPHWEFQELLTERRIEACAKRDDLNRALPA